LNIWIPRYSVWLNLLNLKRRRKRRVKVVEQIKDRYGNLIQLWGIYEVERVVLDSNLPYPRKNQKKKLLSTHKTLSLAKKALE